MTKHNPTKSAELSELDQLRAEIKRLQSELAILKRAYDFKPSETTVLQGTNIESHSHHAKHGQDWTNWSI